MRDLCVFEALLHGDLGAPDFAARLAELSALPLADRAPYLGVVEAALGHDRPQVRVAALGLLRSANGRPAIRALLAALDDDDERVRRAALDVFQTCVAQQPGRWAHLLFHPRSDVREAAVAELPRSAWRMGLHLLADPSTASLMRQQLARADRPKLQAADVGLVVGLWRGAYLDAVEASKLLSEVNAKLLVDWARIGGQRRTDAVEAALEDCGRTEVNPEASEHDAFDPLLTLALHAAALGSTSLARQLREELARADTTTRWRAAASVVLVAGQQRPSPERDPLLVACYPKLLSSSMPRGERREAARSLNELERIGVSMARDKVEGWLTELAETDTGELDLQVVAGVLRLTAPGQAIKALNRVIGPERLVAAVQRNPTAAAPLLSPKCLPQQQREKLLDRLRKHPRVEMGSLLALASWVLPKDELGFLDELSAATALDVALALVAIESRPEVRFTSKKLHQIAQRLGHALRRDDEQANLDPWLNRTLRPLRDAWLAADAPHELELASQIFGAVTACIPAPAFCEVCLELDDARLAVLLEVLPALSIIPYGKELALAHALLEAEREAFRDWARERAVFQSQSAVRLPPAAGVSRLLETEKRDLTHCSHAELESRLAQREIMLEGLVAVLAERTDPPAPSVAVAAALLTCHDDADEVAAQLARYLSERDPSLWLQLDQALVLGWVAVNELPLLAAAYLWRWEQQAFRFGELAQGRLPEVLAWARQLPLCELRQRVWSATARVLALWGARDQNRFWAEVKDGRELATAAVEQLDTELGGPAANLLAALHRSEVPGVAPLIDTIRGMLPDLAADVAAKLSGILDTRGVHFAALGSRHHARQAGDTELRGIRQSSALDQLEEACRSPAPALVEEAVLRLLELDGGTPRLSKVLAEVPEVPRLEVLADSLSLWSDAVALEAARALLTRTASSPRLRFMLALAFVSRGDHEHVADAYAACLEATDDMWFRRSDYARLLSADDPARVALALCRSPHPHAYRSAVAALLRCDLEVSQAEKLASLRAFLACGWEREAKLRLEVADLLFAQGDTFGFPLIVSDVLRTATDRTLRKACGASLLVVAARGVLMAGASLNSETTLVGLLRDAPIEARDQALQAILVDAHNPRAAQDAVAQLDQRFARLGKLRQLAELFAWGFKTGLTLTGRHHRPHMTTDGAYGFVRRNDPRVYVTPLPLLRGDQYGKDVVQGLILHELGHHRWHSGPDNDRIWARAEKERMHGLLNLVADEHLERNLRAMRAPWGDKLKRLAAHAFQHADKEVDVFLLLRTLGVHAAGALTRCELRVAHHGSKVVVDSGPLLRVLEERGHAFARFMRALRMGLGNRHDDPRVAQALALFPPSFRKLEMPQLLKIAYQLRDIFGDDSALLDSFGGAETLDEGERAALEASGSLSDAEVQPEVERILDPRKLKQGRRGGRGGSGKLAINVTGVEHFDRITTVRRLVVDPAAHRELASAVARPAAKLRRFLEELGIQRQPVTRRTRGTRLDRARLQSLVLYRDPRVLMARQPHFDTDLFLGIIVDCSGSMEFGDNIIKAKRFAVLLAEAARGLAGIDVRIFGFTDREIYDAGDAHRCAAATLDAGGGNNDAAGLLHAAEVAKQSRRRAKVLVMISDGLPTECSTEALTSLVRRLEQREHMVLAQVAVRPLEEQCFRHYVRLDEGDVQQVVVRFGEVIAKLVRKALR